MLKAGVVLLAVVLAGISIGDAQAAPCSYAISPLTATQPFSGGAGLFAMTVRDGCAWTASSTNTWLHTTSAGSGNGQIFYNADANASTASRVGYISAAGIVVSVTQAGMPASLSAALDSPSLVWQTDATYPWAGVNPPAPTYDGQASAASGNKFVNDSVSWLQTEIVGPGQISFWWKVDSDVTPEPPAEPYSWDSLQFLLNGELQSEIRGGQDWCYRSFAVPAGTNIARWEYVKDLQYHLGEDKGWLDQVIFTTNTPSTLALALNTCGVEWTTGGNTNPTYWAAQTTVSHDGAMAARSGAITHNQESWMEAMVSGATNVSFWWAVSSESNSDWLEFWTNGVMAVRISGEASWQSNYFRLSAPTNTLRWRYVKNSLDYSSKGQDAGWVDQVKVSPGSQGGQYSLLTPVRLPGGGVQISIAAQEGGCPCTVQVSTNLLNWETLTNLVTEGSLTTIVDDGAASIPTRFYRALSQ